MVRAQACPQVREGGFGKKTLVRAGGPLEILVGPDRHGRKAGLLALFIQSFHVLPVKFVNLLILGFPCTLEGSGFFSGTAANR